MAGIIMLPVFYVAVFHLQKNVVQQAMKKKLKHQQLVTIEIPVHKICWYIPGKEILVNGSLFDVESIVYNNGIALIKGLYDTQEKELDKQLSQATGQNQNSSLNHILIRLLGFFLLANEQVNAIQFALLYSQPTTYGGYYTCQLPLHYNTVPTPPPLA